MAEQEPVKAPLILRLFGPMDVQREGEPLPRLATRKRLWLLALLALRHDREVDRQWLVGTLWPDSEEPQALAGLRQSLADIRRALGSQADRIRATPSVVRLDLTDAFCDALAFDAAIQHHAECGKEESPSPSSFHRSRLEEAVALYRGPLLEGCTEEWALAERESREMAYLKALQTLARQAMERGDPGEAARLLRRFVTTSPFEESAHRALMKALAAQNDPAAATQVYRDLRALLRRELNTAPSAETAALYEQIRAGARRLAEAPLRPASAPADVGSGARSAPDWAAEGATLTFLLTDVEGSTRLWEAHPEAMRQAFARHDALAAGIVEASGGMLVTNRGEGDSLFCLFPRATDALSVACALQRAFCAEPWPLETPLRVRMALHAGEAERREGGFYGADVNRCARLKEIGHGGQILLSQSVRVLSQDHLPEDCSLQDLGLQRLKDLQRPERVYQLLHPSLPAEFPPLQSLDPLPTNLPQHLTSFIGRERELAEIKALLTRQNAGTQEERERRSSLPRLITLVGMGGLGKTRLALQAAAELRARFPEGVWFVDLSMLSDPAHVPEAMAAALGVGEEAGRPLAETLTDHIRERPLLIVLDNCEHVIEACGRLADTLLARCPALRLLATSRQALGIPGELAWPVPPLPLPPETEESPLRGDTVPMGGLLGYAAVRLLAERALDHEPRFALTAENAAAVRQICRRLDGIPLAIELAAARAKVLSMPQIAARLRDRFRLLTGGSHTAPTRQQTLRATLDWSYDLLTEPERLLLRRLAVFAGGWTLEAAEAVASDGEAGASPSSHAFPLLPDDAVLDTLASLVEKSLVVADTQGAESRYRMLETIRQYGWERLEETGERQALRERHRDYFLKLAAEVEPRLGGGEQAAWLERLEAEHENFRAALEFCRTDENSARKGLHLASLLWRFWLVRGHLREGRAWIEEMLQKAGDASAYRRAHALNTAGLLAWNQGDLLPARAYHEESLALYRQLADTKGVAGCLNNLGLVLTEMGEFAPARALYAESLALKREAGDEHGVASSLLNLGLVSYYEGDYGRARAFYQESLVVARKLGQKWGIGLLLSNLAGIHLLLGDPATARTLLEESLAIRRELGDRQGIAQSLSEMGRMACSQGDHAAAASLYAESLAIRQELGDKRGILDSLSDFAHLTAERGEPERAARLYGAIKTIQETTGVRRTQRNDRDDPTIAALRARLGAEAFERLWLEGLAMTMEPAIALAR